MDWLHKLISADAPENASLQSASLSLRGIFPWWAAVLVVIAVAAGVGFLYARETARFGAFRRLLMVAFRTAALAVLLLLLLRPVLVTEYRGERPRGVALLIDNSQSMKQQDRRLSPQDRLRVAIAEDLLAPDTTVSSTNVPAHTSSDPDRAHLVRAVLANPRVHLIQDLQRKGPLRTYLFGQRLHSAFEQNVTGGNASEEADWLGSFKAEEPRTALADAVNDLLQHKEGDLPTAIVLMTDGRDNASKLSFDEVAQESARLKVPLHIYGVGASEGGILQLKDIGVPDTLLYEDLVTVPVRWRSQGLKQGTVRISLRLGDKVVAEREVAVREGDDVREELTFVPHKGDEREAKANLAVAIQLKGNDAFKDELTRAVRLVDRRVRVLYVENSPRWEFKFLQTTLLRDRRVDASFLLVNADAKVLQSGPPYLQDFPARDKFFSFDLLILGDVPAEYLGTERMNWLRDFVKEGGGLVFVAGRQHAPATYTATPVSEILPVEVLPVKFNGNAEDRPQPYLPVLSDAGRRSEMLALADSARENGRIWKELPPLYWHYPVSKLRPGAVSLIEHPRERMGDKAMPILAAHYYGKGPVLFFATDETWRWRYDVGERYFTRFWGQVIYQLGLPHLLGNARRVQLGLEHSEAIFGRPGAVYARLLDSEYRPLREARIRARLDYLDAKPGAENSQTIMLEAIPGQPGEYRALLAHDLPGRFELKVESPEPASLQYRVELPPQHELETLGMAEDILREAARVSGGKFYREEDLHGLAEQIEPRKAVFTQRQEVLLWNPLALIVFVGLVSAEWVLRKFSNLS
ncbi:MAG TPA: hypothetical protein VGY58_03430 [Gemmataceae bacterium]|nr:hypothetical protein [Gemmataceae bacterium]